MLIRFHIRTITPTFRRANVCVRLYGFTSALSLAPHHVLASLVKGEVLSPEKIRATTGGIVSRCTEPLYPHDHCKRTITPRSHQPSSKPHYPSKSTTPLASPRKRGGGTADNFFWLAVQYSDSPAFTILKLFRAVTVGIEIDRINTLTVCSTP